MTRIADWIFPIILVPECWRAKLRKECYLLPDFSKILEAFRIYWNQLIVEYIYIFLISFLCRLKTPRVIQVKDRSPNV